MDKEEYRSHEFRITQVEAQMSDIRVSISRLEGDMIANNRLTAEIRDNTAEMVHLLKAGKTLGEFAKWAVKIAAFITLVAGFFKFTRVI